MNYPGPPPSPDRARSSASAIAVSAVLGGLLLIGPDIVWILSYQFGGVGYDWSDGYQWFVWSIYTGSAILTTLMLLAWGRSAGKRIGGALVFLLLYGVQRLLVAASMVAALSWLSDMPAPVFHALLYGLYPLAWVLGWSIARRQTGFAWIGLVPALLFVAGATALTWLEIPPSFSPTWLSQLVASLVGALMIFLGIACVWVFDAIGLAMRRSRRPRPGQGPGPGYPPPGPGYQPLGPGYQAPTHAWPQHRNQGYQGPPTGPYPPQGHRPAPPRNDHGQGRYPGAPGNSDFR